MPIKPENRHRYPADWKAIRARILRRAKHRCEGSPLYPDCRAENGKPHPVTRSMVVLTIAHLNHTPEDCRPKNLRAWCQRCHLAYDSAHRAAMKATQPFTEDVMRAQLAAIAESIRAKRKPRADDPITKLAEAEMLGFLKMTEFVGIHVGWGRLTQ